MLSIKMFGPFDTQLNDAPAPSLRLYNGAILLAFLVLHHDRFLKIDWLADIIWPLGNASLASLRQSLKVIRSALGEEAYRVETVYGAVRFESEGVYVDVLDFDRLIEKGDIDSLKRALLLYRGPLLQDWAYNWVEYEREQYRERYLNAIISLAQQAKAAGDNSTAIVALRRLVQERPSLESGWFDLMETFIVSGERIEALEVYRRYCEYLNRVSGGKLQPPAEMKEQYQKVLESRQGAAEQRLSDIIPKLQQILPGGYGPIGGKAALALWPLDSRSFIERLTGDLAKNQKAYSFPDSNIPRDPALKIIFLPHISQASLEYNDSGQTYTHRVQGQLYWLLRHVVLCTLNYIDTDTDALSRKCFHWSWAFYLFDLPEVKPERLQRVQAGFVRQVHYLNALIAKLVSGNSHNRDVYILQAETYGAGAQGLYSIWLGTPQLPMGETNIEQVDIFVGDNATKDPVWRNQESQRCLRAIANIRQLFLQQNVNDSVQINAANQTVIQIQQMQDRLQIADIVDPWISEIVELVKQVQRLDSHEVIDEVIDKDQNVAIAPPIIELADSLSQAVITPLVKQVNLSPSEWRKYGFEALFQAAKIAQPRWGTRKQVQEYFYFALLIFLALAKEANEEIVNRAVLAFGKQMFGEQMKESYSASIYAWMLDLATERASVLRSMDIVRSLKKDWSHHRSLYSEG